jgi:16S rRNA (adenine(1408)-N(1))-methyltransferase
MADSARRAARAGIANLLFVQAAIETLPVELTGVADRITVNYPWGSLLRAVAAPDIGLLAAIAGTGRPGATFTLLVNMSVFDDAGYCARLGLPHPPILADAGAAVAAFGAAGLDVTAVVADLAVLPYKTSWGQRLVRGSRRRILRLDAITRALPKRPPRAD